VAIDLPPAAPYHRATIEAIGHAAQALATPLDVDARATGPALGEALGAVDGIVIGPGSPYRDEAAVWDLIRAARERGVPLVGT